MSHYPYFKKLLQAPILPIIAIVLLTAVVYSNSLHCEFIFDDHLYITGDPAIRVTEPSPKNFMEAAINGKPKHRLLPNLTFAANYYFGRYRVEGYHLFNITIHMLTGFFLFLLFRMTLSFDAIVKSSEFVIPAKAGTYKSLKSLDCGLRRNDGKSEPGHGSIGKNEPGPGSIGETGILMLSGFAACLWLLHPVQAQAVTYIVQRMTSLSALFYILSILCYIQGRKSWQSGLKQGSAFLFFSGCIVFGLCAFSSKENAATLPIIILLYEWFFFQKLKIVWSKTYVLLIIGVLLLFGIIAVIYLGENPFHRITAAYKFRDYTLFQRVLTQLRVVIYYISLFFFPHPARLTLDYDYPLSDGLLLPATTLISAMAIIALFVLAIYLAFRKKRLAAFCIFWFFVTLSIESSIIAIEIIYEHRLYLSMVMPVLFCMLALTGMLQSKWTTAVVMGMILIICGTWTYQRNTVWTDQLTFWQDNHRKFPEDARVLNNLGLALLNAGNIDEAMGYLRKSIHIQSTSETPRVTLLEPMNNLALAFIRKQEYNSAFEILERAIEIDSTSFTTCLNMGLTSQKMGRLNDAIDYYETALQSRPWSTEAMNGLGGVYFQQGDAAASVRMFEKALSIDPENIEAHLKIGSVLLEMKKFTAATEHYLTAAMLDPENASVYFRIGMAYAKQRRFPDAIHYYEKARQMDPNDMEVLFQLAVTHAYLKDYETAVGVFEQMLSITPDNPKIPYNIGCLYALQNRTEEAVSRLEQAIQNGYDNWDRIKSDPDLENIRHSELFKDLLYRTGNR